MANLQESVCIGAALLFALGGLVACSKSSAPNASGSGAPVSSAPAAVAKTSGNIDIGTLLTQQDAEEIVGKGATLTRGAGANACTITAADKVENYMVSLNNVGANVEGAMKGALMALQNAQPVPGIGDEAFSDSNGLLVRKGQVMIIIGGAAPNMSRVPEVEKKLALKLIAKL